MKDTETNAMKYFCLPLQEDYEERMREVRWSEWQTIRRHPDYIKFCDCHSFDSNDMLPEDLATAEDVIALKERFGLREVFHYRKDFSREQCVEAPLFAHGLAVIRIWPQKVGSGGPQVVIPQQLPTHGEFIYLGINIDEDVTWKVIEAEIRRTISHARAVLHILRKSTSSKEPHQEKKSSIPRKEVFEIWDLWKQKKTIHEIIATVYPDEYREWVKNPDRWSANEAVDELFNDLRRKYEKQGMKDEDAHEKAYLEAYGTLNEEGPEGNVRMKLYMRVYDKIRKMEELLSAY